jgi:hypothetical protein
MQEYQQAAEKEPYASLRLIDFTSTYKSTPPLINLRALRLGIFLISLQRLFQRFVQYDSHELNDSLP